MLCNATILRIDTPGPSTTGGRSTTVAGQPVSVRCAVFASDATDTYPDPARLVDKLTATLRVTPAALGPLAIVPESQLLIQPDGAGQAWYSAWKIGPRPKGSISFIEAELISA